MTLIIMIIIPFSSQNVFLMIGAQYFRIEGLQYKHIVDKGELWLK